MGVRALEQHKPGRPLRVRHQGALVCLPDPVDLTHEEIEGHIQSEGRTLMPDARMPYWKAALLLDRWLAHHGMGTRQEALRLAWLVEKYEQHLIWDLQAHAGVDLGTLWRAREYHRLVTLIDRLPRNTYYNDALSSDPEHSRMIAEAQARAKDENGGEDPAPRVPLTSWTPEVAALTDVLDAVRGVQHTLVMVNADPKKSPPKPPEPAPRPTTRLQAETAKAENRRRQKNHESLADRLLPHRRRKQDESAADTIAP